MTAGAHLLPSILRTIEAGFLPGYKPAHTTAFATWHERFHQRTVTDLCQSLLREVDRTLSSGDLAVAELAARACLTLDPSHSGATVALAYVMARRTSFGASPLAGPFGIRYVDQ